ncbi:cation diffusion facilitator family transporter [Halocola ammonii]
MGHSKEYKPAETGNLKVAFFLNTGFTIIEIIGGIWTGSIAVISDAVHDLGDSLSLGLSWYFQNLSHRKRDHNFTFGYQRFTLLGAIVNSVVLIVGAIFIIIRAVPALTGEHEVNAQGMMWLAILGVVVNGAAALRLRKGHTLNEKAVALHLIEDVLGWVAVLIVSIVLQFKYIAWLDPALSLLIVVYILFNVFKNLKESFKIILQGTPKDVDIREIEKILQDLPGIEDYHDFHVWSMDGEYNVLSVHIATEPGTSYEEMSELKMKLREKLLDLPIHHTTVEVEYKGEPDVHPSIHKSE